MRHPRNYDWSSSCQISNRQCCRLCIWDSMFKQVEFLIQEPLLPMTISKLQVSSSFIIEDATSKKEFREVFALAFVGVEDEPNRFKRASSRVNLFLLLHALITGQTATYHQGAAIPLSTLENLGRNRVYFSWLRKNYPSQ